MPKILCAKWKFKDLRIVRDYKYDVIIMNRLQQCYENKELRIETKWKVRKENSKAIKTVYF